MKKIMILALIVAFMVSMLFIGTSCKPEAAAEEEAVVKAAEEEAPAEEAIEEVEPVTIEFWTFGEFATAQAMIDSIAEFEAANPNITVELVGKPDTEITVGVIAGASSGEMPDVYNLALNTGYEMIKAGGLYDMSAEWNTLSAEYKAQFAPGVVSLLNQDGKVYGIPYTLYATVLFRNLTVLEQAGIDPAAGITDWADWLTQMQKVKEAGFVALPNYSLDGWLVMHYLGGVSGVTNDVVDGETTITVEQLAKAYTFIKDAKAYGADMSPFDAAATDLFITDQMAFYEMGPWAEAGFFAPAREANANFKYDFVLMPGETAGYNGGVHGGEFFAIAPGTDSAKVAAAIKLAVFLADKSQVLKLSLEFSGRACFNDEAMADPAMDEFPLVKLTVEAATMGMTDAAYFKNFPLAVRQPLADNAASARDGVMTPEEAAQAAIDAINLEISK